MNTKSKALKGSTRRFTSLLASLGLLLITIVVFSLFIRPSYEEINQLRGEMAARSRIFEEQQQIVTKVKELLAQYQSVQQLRDTISLAIPIGEDYATLINQINGLSKAAEMRLVSISIATPSGQINSRGAQIPQMQELQFTLEMSGPYESLKTFLQMTETNMRVMDLESLTINPGSGTGQNYLYNIVVKTYYQS